MKILLTILPVTFWFPVRLYGICDQTVLEVFVVLMGYPAWPQTEFLKIIKCVT